MEKIGNILESKEVKLNKCPKCGKEYKLHEQVIFKGTDKEKVLRIQTPTCNCEELERQREEAAKEAASKRKNDALLPEDSFDADEFIKAAMNKGVK